jgi:hypothetical protein
VRSKSTSETLTQVKPKEEGIKAQASPPISEITRKIMQLESSGGVNNYSKCQAIGKYNRFGYGIPGNGQYQCFEKDEDTKAVEKWFEKKLAEMDLETAICHYNLGTKTNNCEYLNNFKKL